MGALILILVSLLHAKIEASVMMAPVFVQMDSRDLIVKSRLIHVRVFFAKMVAPV